MMFFCSLVFLASLSVFPAQANSLTILQLNNRPAEEILPVIRPMLNPGEVVSGQGFKLFLRSSRETLEQVEAMLEVLDAAAKMLLISVFQGSRRDLDSVRVDASLRIEGGSGSVEIGNRNDNSAGSIDFGNDNVSGGIDATGKRELGQDKPVHQLRVAEGREGFIHTGRQIPYFTGISRPSSGTVVGTTEYKDVTNGFYVLPRIHGNSITLEISPFKNSLSGSNDGSINTQSANTVIRGPMGRWLPIGGVSEQSSGSQSGIGSYSSSDTSRDDHIWIRADLVR